MNASGSCQRIELISSKSFWHRKTNDEIGAGVLLQLETMVRGFISRRQTFGEALRSYARRRLL